MARPCLINKDKKLISHKNREILGDNIKLTSTHSLEKSSSKMSCPQGGMFGKTAWGCLAGQTDHI
jgi:hypothetical protein